MKRSPLKPIGKRRQKIAPWQHSQRALAVERSKGMCEFYLGCTKPGTDWAHAFGRGNIVGEPLCSYYNMTWMLCREHHDYLDNARNEKAVKDRTEMRWQALDLTFKEFNLDYNYFWLNFTAEGAARELANLKALDSLV